MGTAPPAAAAAPPPSGAGGVIRIGASLALATTLALLATAGTSVESRAVACPLAETGAPVCIVWPPSLHFDLAARVAPRMLPRGEAAPVALRLAGFVKTRDGTHPSALREILLDVDRDVVLSAASLPACRGRLLKGLDVREARTRCRDSIVGRGEAHVAISPEEEIVPATLTLFNGGVADGKRSLYIHSFLATPNPTAYVASVAMQKIGSGLHTIARIPPIANGQGSLVDFDLTIERALTHPDETKSYLEAKCPDDVFKVNVGKLLFRNETSSPGVASTTVLKGGLTVPCTPIPRAEG
jgi:hypothetical protein